MEIIKIGDCAIITQGKNINKKFLNNEKKGLPYVVGASCLKGSGVVCSKYTEYPEKSEITILGDVLVSTVGTLGKIAVNNIGNCVLSKHVCAVRFVPQILPEYGMLCLMGAIHMCIPEDDGVQTGFSRRLDISAIEELPLTLVGINQQRATVEKMMFLGEQFFELKGKSSDVKELMDDPIELIHNFEKEVTANLREQRRALRKIVEIINSDRNNETEYTQFKLW